MKRDPVSKQTQFPQNFCLVNWKEMERMKEK